MSFLEHLSPPLTDLVEYTYLRLGEEQATSKKILTGRLKRLALAATLSLLPMTHPLLVIGKFAPRWTQRKSDPLQLSSPIRFVRLLSFPADGGIYIYPWRSLATASARLVPIRQLFGTLSRGSKSVFINYRKPETSTCTPYLCNSARWFSLVSPLKKRYSISYHTT